MIVDARDAYVNPIGHEKKYTWKSVKYRKNTRGKKCIPCADRILIAEKTSQIQTILKTLNAKNLSPP